MYLSAYEIELNLCIINNENNYTDIPHKLSLIMDYFQMKGLLDDSSRSAWFDRMNSTWAGTLHLSMGHIGEFVQNEVNNMRQLIESHPRSLRKYWFLQININYNPLISMHIMYGTIINGSASVTTPPSILNNSCENYPYFKE